MKETGAEGKGQEEQGRGKRGAGEREAAAAGEVRGVGREAGMGVFVCYGWCGVLTGWWIFLFVLIKQR